MRWPTTLPFAGYLKAGNVGQAPFARPWPRSARSGRGFLLRPVSVSFASIWVARGRRRGGAGAWVHHGKDGRPGGRRFREWRRDRRCRCRVRRGGRIQSDLPVFRYAHECHSNCQGGHGGDKQHVKQIGVKPPGADGQAAEQDHGDYREGDDRRPYWLRKKAHQKAELSRKQVNHDDGAHVVRGLAAAKPEQSYRRRFFASAALGRALYPRFPRCSASAAGHDRMLVLQSEVHGILSLVGALRFCCSTAHCSL
jgi:hypothetical protein